MRERAPFQAADLEDLDRCFFTKASAVVAMQEVHAGNRSASVIGLRHDCDAGHSLATAVNMAKWEADRHYRSTYFVLHTSPYWGMPGFRKSLETIACHGHEIGLHVDSMAEALKTNGDPDKILEDALTELRSYGFPVRGVAGHGNPLCNRDRAEGEGTFANDEVFTECARPKEGLPDRWLSRGSVRLRLRPRPLADFGLDYEALVLGHPNPFRFSDSGGRWLNPGWAETVAAFPDSERQLHFLQHPDWYRECWSPQAVAA